MMMIMMVLIMIYDYDYGFSFNFSGFIEYLLDRKTEQEKEGKELKYNILKTIAESVTSKENLGENYYEKICKYVREGPFYSEQQTAIDYERQS